MILGLLNIYELSHVLKPNSSCVTFLYKEEAEKNSDWPKKGRGGCFIASPVNQNSTLQHRKLYPVQNQMCDRSDIEKNLLGDEKAPPWQGVPALTPERPAEEIRLVRNINGGEAHELPYSRSDINLVSIWQHLSRMH